MAKNGLGGIGLLLAIGAAVAAFATRGFSSNAPPETHPTGAKTIDLIIQPSNTPATIQPVVSSPGTLTTTPSITSTPPSNITQTEIVITPAGSYIGNHAVGEGDEARQRAIAAAADAMQRAERAKDQAYTVYQEAASRRVAYDNPASGMQEASSGYYYAGVTEEQQRAYDDAIQAFEDARLYLESLVRS